jgi:hypothetical protein
MDKLNKQRKQRSEGQVRNPSRRQFLKKTLIAAGVTTPIVQSFSIDEIWAQASPPTHGHH